MADERLPSSWLAPALHSVYLHAMINFAENVEDGTLFSERNIEFRPGLHSYLQTYNLLKQLHFSTDPATGFAFGLSVPPAAHGAMGQAAVSSSSVSDAFATIARFTSMRNNTVEYGWSKTAEFGALTLNPLFDMREYANMIVAATAEILVPFGVALASERNQRCGSVSTGE